MKTRYIDLIEQTFEFPQDAFSVNEDFTLEFNEIPLMDIIKQYGTPLKITYLPKISSQIQKAKRFFNIAIAKADYKGKYTYCYCTKSSHFSFVLEEALKNDIHLETSSAYDIPIIRSLNETGKLNKDIVIICNGYKRTVYTDAIIELINEGYTNVIPILDNVNELVQYEEGITVAGSNKVGIRISCEEEPNSDFYSSRLGIRPEDIVPFYRKRIKNNPKFEMKMLHFFINAGIKDNAHYWSELTKCVNVYCDLKKVCPELDSLDIGGGFPIKTSLGKNYNHEYMAELIVQIIKNICEEKEVAEPNIFTEFGSYTVGESGAILYSVIEQKQQNDKECWYMIDSSFITTLPDTWGIKQRFVLLAINKWDELYRPVNLGGVTCDGDDYYNSESHINQIFLPKINITDDEEPLYVGFFHTGAYQESLGGYGGIQHCLVPAPKHVIIDRDEEGEIITRLFAKEQSAKSMLKILGY
jgi:arginine decarboxylase